MKDNEKLKIELQESGFNAESVEDFISNIDYIGNTLDNARLNIPSDLSARTMASVESALANKLRADKYRRALRAVSAAAAVLLMIVSVSVFNSRSGVSMVAGQNEKTVVTAELSGNPFASPSIIMNTLFDRRTSGYSNDITLEAVSELWDGSDSDAGAPTSIRGNRSGFILV